MSTEGGCYNRHSSRCITNVGVLQGTVLGPILFLAHVTDTDDDAVTVTDAVTVFCIADNTLII